MCGFYWATVYIRSVSGVCVGITLLLSMTVFQLIIADKVPESSQAIPLVGMIQHYCYFTVTFDPAQNLKHRSLYHILHCCTFQDIVLTKFRDGHTNRHYIGRKHEILGLCCYSFPDEVISDCEP